MIVARNFQGNHSVSRVVSIGMLRKRRRVEAPNKPVIACFCLLALAIQASLICSFFDFGVKEIENGFKTDLTKAVSCKHHLTTLN